MSKHHDEDEAIHWRARVAVIPDRTPEAATERAGMSEEKITEIRDAAARNWGKAPYGDLAQWGRDIVALADMTIAQRAVLAERDAEIARLRSAMTSVIDNPTITYREAERLFVAALAGEVPDEAMRAERSGEG